MVSHEKSERYFLPRMLCLRLRFFSPAALSSSFPQCNRIKNYYPPFKPSYGVQLATGAYDARFFGVFFTYVCLKC